MRKLLLLTTLSALLAAACGTKGPLVKPPPATPAVQAQTDHSSAAGDNR